MIGAINQKLVGTPRNDVERMMRKTGGVQVALWIGIDPGVNTGYAIWSSRSKQFLVVESKAAVEAEVDVVAYWNMSLASMASPAPTDIHVVVEDTRKLRLPKHLQSAGRTKGAGSVGRDMQRWAEFLTHHGIPHTMAPMSPKEFRTMDDAAFRKKTGWDKRTNEHGRSAAGLIWNR